MSSVYALELTTRLGASATLATVFCAGRSNYHGANSPSRVEGTTIVGMPLLLLNRTTAARRQSYRQCGPRDYAARLSCACVWL